MNKVEQYKNIEDKINKAEANRDKEELIRLAKEYNNFSGSVAMSLYTNFKDYNSAKKLCKEKQCLATGLTLALKNKDADGTNYFLDEYIKAINDSNKQFRNLSKDDKVKGIINALNLNNYYSKFLENPNIYI